MAKSPSQSGASGAAPDNWRERYLASLDELEQNQRRHQQFVSLLSRTLSRVALAAEGIDQRLDGQLGRVRDLLRKGDSTLKELTDAVQVLELQIERVDKERPKRLKTSVAAFRSLSEQLRKRKPDDSLQRQLKQFEKRIKPRVASQGEWPSLVSELADLQRQVLAREAGTPAPGLLRRLFDRPARQSESAPAEAPAESDNAEEAPSREPEQALPDTIHELPERVSQEHPPASSEGEPPFARISRPICQVLDEMLTQIEPPPSARENYAAAREQVDRGLNWYELVPTLEDIGIVVMAAIDRDQQEFEAFLKQLNDRLQRADEAIHHSRAAEAERQEAGKALTDSVRASVSDIQAHVEKAAGLDQLKAEVSGRLEAIVGAIDSFQAGEQSREVSLTEQLNALVERVQSMEEASRSAEARIEEQRKLALRDVLTQLPNREAYNQRLEQELARWQRYRRPLSLAVCDIDFFKKINDSYGHLAGDKVLRIIAKTLRKRLRKTDFIARYGGEEFVILMPETGGEQALQTLDKLREAIAACPFHFREQRVSITLSFGVAEVLEGDRAEHLFDRADRCLYSAKEQGRNQCRLASPERSQANPGK